MIFRFSCGICCFPLVSMDPLYQRHPRCCQSGPLAPAPIAERSISPRAMEAWSLVRFDSPVDFAPEKNIQTTMEHHHFLWKNQVYVATFNSYIKLPDCRIGFPFESGRKNMNLPIFFYHRHGYFRPENNRGCPHSSPWPRWWDLVLQTSTSPGHGEIRRRCTRNGGLL